MAREKGGAPSIQCIYCQEDKPVSAYKKVEHVIPQSFGGFKGNFTLLHLVCDVCNQFLGDKLELALARDTLEGQSRTDFGVKKAEEFKSPGRSSRIELKLAEGPFKGAHAFLDYSEADGKIIPKPIPQAGFRQKVSGKYEYFTLDEIPERMSLETRGFDLHAPGSIRLVGGGVEEISRRLRDKGISFQPASEVTDESSSSLYLVQGTIDGTIRRAVAKIAFNYLARWEGREFVRHSSFDDIRNFVRHGLMPYALVRVTQEPILKDEETKRRVGHLITLAWAADGTSIVAQVSLLNSLTYVVCLARNYKGERREITRGHFFNIADKQIFELGAS